MIKTHLELQAIILRQYTSDTEVNAFVEVLLQHCSYVLSNASKVTNSCGSRMALSTDFLTLKMHISRQAVQRSGDCGHMARVEEASQCFPAS